MSPIFPSVRPGRLIDLAFPEPGLAAGPLAAQACLRSQVRKIDQVTAGDRLLYWTDDRRSNF
jgi:hypothetical protein